MKWEEDKLTWYLNNEIIVELEESSCSSLISDNIMRIYFTVRVYEYDSDKFWVEDLSENIPNDLVIDYIRVYNLDQSESTLIREGEINIRVFPNPAKDLINIEAPMNSKIQIFNVEGKSVYSNFSFVGVSIDVSAFNSGMYFIVIEHEGNIFSEKIIIEN